MPRLPSISPFRPLPVFQQERLARWLLEWELDQALHGDAPEATPVFTTSKAPFGKTQAEADPSDFDQNVRAGDIRLLSSTLLPDSDAQVILAVLQQWGTQFLVAPFSRFAEPATPNELLLRSAEDADPALRVLCLWNARTVPRDTLERSWRYGSMSHGEIADALAVFADLQSNEELPTELATRVGSGIVVSWDPRHRYIAEGVELLSPLTRASLAAVTESAHSSRLVSFAGEDASKANSPALAAHGRKPGAQRAFSRFAVGDSGAVVLLEECWNPPNTFGLEVLTDPDHRLESADVMDSAGNVVAKIEGGKSGKPFVLAKNVLVLRLSDGTIVPLNEIAGS